MLIDVFGVICRFLLIFVYGVVGGVGMFGVGVMGLGCGFFDGVGG